MYSHEADGPRTLQSPRLERTRVFQAARLITGNKYNKYILTLEPNPVIGAYGGIEVLQFLSIKSLHLAPPSPNQTRPSPVQSKAIETMPS
jgi:hypothetical protein